MDFKKINLGCLYAQLLVCALSVANSGYNLVNFYSVSEVSQLSTNDYGPVRVRNYRNRRDLVEDVKDPEQKIQAKKYLDNLDTSNAVIGISGLAAIGTGAGLIASNSIRKR